jgi:hypothetical protein
MGSTRALFASIGVSVALVAAAALSLFTVSVVIAFGGWSAGLGEAAPVTTLVFGPTEPSGATDAMASTTTRAPVVLHRSAASRPRPAAHPASRVGASAGVGTDPRAVSRPAVTAYHPSPAAAPQATTPAPSAVHLPPTGDGVRRVGEDLSSTVHSTGKALADATAPLAPPVSAAVQKVLDLVAVLLQRTTNGLGGTLDTLGK